MEEIKAKLIFIMREEGTVFEPSTNKMRRLDEIDDFFENEFYWCSSIPRAS